MKRIIKRWTQPRRNYGLHRCTLKGCGQFHRTAGEAIVHETDAAHCKHCGFGLTGFPGESMKPVFCLSCEIEWPTPAPTKRVNVN